MITSEYACCAGGACPQHVQQYRELQAWAEVDMLERRFVGNTNARKTIYGGMI